MWSHICRKHVILHYQIQTCVPKIKGPHVDYWFVYEAAPHLVKGTVPTNINNPYFSSSQLCFFLHHDCFGVLEISAIELSVFSQI